MNKKLLSLLIALLIAAVGFMGYSGYRYYSIQHSYKVADDYRQQLKDIAFSGNNISDVEIVEEADPESENKLKSPLDIDFDELAKQVTPNGKIVGWLYSDNGIINYPVMWSPYENYFLYNNYSGRNTGYGELFIPDYNYTDFSDLNTVIHGHHMQDGSMFYSLQDWLKQDYYEEHPVMWLNTVESGNYMLEIVASCISTSNPDEAGYFAYDFNFPTENDYANWLRNVKSRSYIATNSELHTTDRFVTMSTCAYTDVNARTVVIARLVPAK